MDAKHVFDIVQCDSCGCDYFFHELVETIEEYLCEHCASGVGPDGDEWEPDDWNNGINGN
jgi:hypothetical protein